MNTIEVLGVNFVGTGILEAVEYGMRAMEHREGKYVVAPDSEMMLAARKSKRLMRAIQGAELILPEGSGVIYASRILGIPIKRKICAIDYGSALMARMSEKNMRVFLLGVDGETARLAAERIGNRYPGIVMAGSSAGNYDTDEKLLEVVNAAEADLLLVCYGTPKQELWMSRNAGLVKAGLMLGFGKEIKIVAGLTQQIPQKWRDNGCEWLYKIIKEPHSILRVAKRSGVLLAAIKRRLIG